MGAWVCTCLCVGTRSKACTGCKLFPLDGNIKRKSALTPHVLTGVARASRAGCVVLDSPCLEHMQAHKHALMRAHSCAIPWSVPLTSSLNVDARFLPCFFLPACCCAAAPVPGAPCMVPPTPPSVLTLLLMGPLSMVFCVAGAHAA